MKTVMMTEVLGRFKLIGGAVLIYYGVLHDKDFGRSKGHSVGAFRVII